VLVTDGDQPIQAGEDEGSTSGGDALQRPTLAPVMSLHERASAQVSATGAPFSAAQAAALRPHPRRR